MRLTRSKARSLLLGAWWLSVIVDVSGASPAATEAAPAGPVLRLAVDPVPGRSGLLDRLLPPFEAARGLRVAVVVGASSKEALETGAAGGADAVLVHAPRQEIQYLNQGFYLDRRFVARVEYVLVGPPADPAGIKGSRRPVVAFRRIVERQVTFVSREAAASRLLEQELWEKAGVSTRPPWYIRARGGQDEVMALAADRGAYTLVDRASLPRLPAGRLAVILEGAGPLRSDFYYLEVNPHRFPGTRYDDARALGDYLLSPPAQHMMRDSWTTEGEDPASHSPQPRP
jgi:tungstate transport system substrate-binding protein